MRIRKPVTILLTGWLMAAQAVNAQDFPPAEAPVDKAPELPRKPVGNKIFYLPTRDEPRTPAKWGYQYKQLEIISKDGTKLHAWWINA